MALNTKGGRGVPIVDDSAFTDTRPTIGQPSTSFNPGKASEILPNGPPKYVQPQGKRVMAKGLTNKRITGNI